MRFDLKISQKTTEIGDRNHVIFFWPSRAILTAILGANLLRKFAENPSQTCLHTLSRAKIAENEAKMLPMASTRLQNTSPSVPKGFQEDQIWQLKTTGFDPNPRLPTPYSQLAARTLHHNYLRGTFKTIVPVRIENSHCMMRTLPFTEHSFHFT